MGRGERERARDRKGKEVKRGSGSRESHEGKRKGKKAEVCM